MKRRAPRREQDVAMPEIIEATYHDEVQRVKELLNAGVDPDTVKARDLLAMRPVYVCAQRNSIEVAKLLLEEKKTPSRL